MEWISFSGIGLITWLTISLSAAILFLILPTLLSPNRSNKRRPPGPPGWPLFGNMFYLGKEPHKNLFKLKSEYGPVVWLKLGTMDTVVIQSADAAAEFFKKHDMTFIDRKVPQAMTALGFNESSMSFSDYGLYWRIVRKLASSELLVNLRLNQSSGTRQKCIDKMINLIAEDSGKSLALGGTGEVELTPFFFRMAFNLIGNLMLSRDLLDTESKEGRDFYLGLNGILEWVGTPNSADYLPFLKWIDPQGIKRKMKRDLNTCIKIISKFVKERIQEKEQSTEELKKEFVDVFLDHEGQDGISERDIYFVIMEVFFAGSKTISLTLEWAMTELLRNPITMKNVKQDLARLGGPDRKIVESDINNLPYLHAVVKETLRLHGPGPFLLPRKAKEDVEYMGYTIPKDTQVIVNIWGIGRDPDSWDDPESFKPERFLESNIEYNGQHFQFLPFGGGRRICVGYFLAHRMVHLGLATLLQSFDWELNANYATPETMDMEETNGLTLQKKVPLKAIPKKRIA